MAHDAFRSRVSPRNPTSKEVLSPDVWPRLERRVVRGGLCTHCGTCAGLSAGALAMVAAERGPLPTVVGRGIPLLPEIVWDACPGKGVDYPALARAVFGNDPENWLIGHYRRIYLGYSAVPAVRRGGASGGVITQTLLYLLEQGEIDGAVVVQQGTPRPWQAAPVIATTPAQIMAASQSVYQPVPVNALLEEMARFDGRLAYVGLPDQVAALRMLQAAGHPAACKVRMVLGPYVGTNLYARAIESYLAANGVESVEEVEELRWRDGEWPGHLMIRLRSGRVLAAEKFYYNYLIPFFVTHSSLHAVDFTNELTDISVGDAWHPRYEAQGGGFSVVTARSAQGDALLAAMQAAGVLHLEELGLAEALSMHGHMLDLKKRGAFIRLGWRAALGLPVPAYGYRPIHIPTSRKLVEAVIVTIFALGGTRSARRLAEWIPISVLGPLFNTARKAWKDISKPAKRRGLLDMHFEVTTGEHGTLGHSERSDESRGAAGITAKMQAELAHWRRRDWRFAAVAAHWDATEDYDDINAKTYSYFRRFVDGLRLSDLRPHGRVLDLCARTGNGTLYFHQHGKVGSAVCADVSAKMGDVCRARLSAGGVTDFVWLQIFDYDLPLPSAEFNTVFCFETVEHFAQPQRLLHELGRVTAPGGTMILTTPNVLWEPVHTLAAVTGLHHSEGPHRFIGYLRLVEMVHQAGFVIERAETTVLVPGGPQALVRLGERIEAATQRTLMPWLGLRRMLVCRKR